MSAPSQYTDVAQSGAYRSGGMENTYTLEPGVFVLPVAEEPPTNTEELTDWSPVVVVQAHAPYRIRQVKFSTKKSGSPPVLPSPQDCGAFTFIGGSLYFPSPAADPSGSRFLWHGAGEYVFVEEARSAVEDGFVLGSDPIPNSTYLALRQILPAGQPQTGAVSQAGDEVKIAYGEAGQVSLNAPSYSYYSTAYFPGVFFNTGMLNGDTTTAGL